MSRLPGREKVRNMTKAHDKNETRHPFQTSCTSARQVVRTAFPTLFTIKWFQNHLRTTPDKKEGSSGEDKKGGSVSATSADASGQPAGVYCVVLVENELKNKSVRKALCSRYGQIFVAVTASDESYHDFSQALIDLGVKDAISLVGSKYAFGWWIDRDGVNTSFAFTTASTLAFPFNNQTD